MDCELDTHEDTCCFGKGAYIMSTDHHSCAKVSGFSVKLGKVISVPIVTATVAYDCPISFQTYILIFHQSLYIEKLNSHLICPNQLRLAGKTVNDCPLQFTPTSKRTAETHLLQTRQLVIQLKLKVVISYFSTRMPSQDEINNIEKYTQLEMTATSLWDPYNETFWTD
jgi:hypothetical protein